MLAECLRHGTGVEADVAQSIGFYRQASSLLDAKLILADLYYFGQEVARNLGEAFHWYEQAAQRHGDSYAMYSYGYCLLHGEGVERDARAGTYWLRRASLQDEAGAQYELGMAYYRGAGVKRSPRLAAKWLRASARLGHEAGQAFLERIERGDRLS